MEIKKIVVASGNAGKIKEIKSIFSSYEIASMKDLGFCEEVEETGVTFKENAYIKAKAVALALNLPTLSDDSGLCVDALDGAPGVFSARFSGKGDKGNRELLLKKLEGDENRSAYFESCVCLYLPDGTAIFGEGKTFGKIMHEESGTNGFGYDCIFYSNDLQKGFGEASDQEKNAVSHRYRALCDLRNKL
ncbi:MAG: RdgB/HAM1 family non-canonical purine NTP pyrophosphatase [Clostridiales bacterium]|nr:RdgB/HAM1 family non-canonical purine NTP pyrophosphatase [Clostridiales bacterium]